MPESPSQFGPYQLHRSRTHNRCMSRSSSKSVAVQNEVICRLKSSDRPLKYLDEIENVMKARSKHPKAS